MFRTELPLTPHTQQLPPTARVLTIGSCFSDSIGNRLSDYKVATLVNPFGTVFNPISACKLLRAAAGEDTDWQQHVVEARGRWQSYDLHATLGADSPVELLQHIQRLVRDTGVFLATADAVVLTLGTAFAYRLQETQEIISNCHKLPADKFEKELLSADEIIAAVAETHAYLRRINPRLRFILTVSPVRHLKETLALSSVSKSMLRVACHYLSELLPDVSYFPAYELLLDDLRDYRFYAADMLHPSDVAENYIWERFTRTYFDTAFGRFKKEWESIRQALNHRPLYIAAPEHRQFLEGTLARLQRLSTHADVRMEMLHVEKELATLPLPPPLPLPEPEEDEDDILEEDASEAYEADDAQARLLSQGSGLLIEADDEEYEQQEELTTNPEVAYESAYSGEELEYADEEDLLTEESSSIDEETGQELPIRKKKRRSRGGAKRSKRKAARLAAEAEASGVAPATEITAVGYSTPGPDEQVAKNSEDFNTTEGITYISEAELFGTAPTLSSQEVVVPAAQAEPLSASVSTPEGVPADEDTPGASGQEPRRRNRPERQPRQQGNRDPRRANRQPLYAVPTTEKEAATSPETPPIGLETPSTQSVAELPDTAVASAPDATPPASASRNRSRGGAGRNRSNAGKDRVAQAAESAAAAGPVTATPVVEAQPIEPPALPTPAVPEPTAPVTAKARPKRAPRKPAAKPTPEAPAPLPTESLPTVPAEKAGSAPKKRPARKASPKATPEEATPAAPTDAPAPVAKKASSRKKAAPTAPAAEAEPAAAKAAPAPRRARPPRRKPAADTGSAEETT